MVAFARPGRGQLLLGQAASAETQPPAGTAGWGRSAPRQEGKPPFSHCWIKMVRVNPTSSEARMFRVTPAGWGLHPASKYLWSSGERSSRCDTGVFLVPMVELLGFLSALQAHVSLRLWLHGASPPQGKPFFAHRLSARLLKWFSGRNTQNTLQYSPRGMSNKWAVRMPGAHSHSPSLHEIACN